jgi:hypothetical protein
MSKLWDILVECLGDILMKYAFASFGFLLLSLSAASAHDNTPRKTYTVLGIGTVSCGTWTKNVESGATAAQRAWVQGFVTGYNMLIANGWADVSEGIDSEGLFAQMTKLCAENPLDDISDATNKLLIELVARRSKR